MKGFRNYMNKFPSKLHHVLNFSKLSRQIDNIKLYKVNPRDASLTGEKNVLGGFSSRLS